MPKDQEWISELISELREQHPGVNEVISTRMKGLLEDQLREHRFNTGELSSLAEELLTSLSDQDSSGNEDNHEG